MNLTFYLYNIKIIMDTFEAIVKNDGKNIAGIVKAEDAKCLRARINEFIEKGLAKQYTFGYREIHLTRKGYEVMNSSDRSRNAWPTTADQRTSTSSGGMRMNETKSEGTVE